MNRSVAPLRGKAGFVGGGGVKLRRRPHIYEPLRTRPPVCDLRSASMSNLRIRATSTAESAASRRRRGLLGSQSVMVYPQWERGPSFDAKATPAVSARDYGDYTLGTVRPTETPLPFETPTPGPAPDRPPLRRAASEPNLSPNRRVGWGSDFSTEEEDDESDETGEEKAEGGTQGGTQGGEAARSGLGALTLRVGSGRSTGLVRGVGDESLLPPPQGEAKVDQTERRSSRGSEQSSDVTRPSGIGTAMLRGEAAGDLTGSPTEEGGGAGEGTGGGAGRYESLATQHHPAHHRGGRGLESSSLAVDIVEGERTAHDPPGGIAEVYRQPSPVPGELARENRAHERVMEIEQEVSDEEKEQEKKRKKWRPLGHLRKRRRKRTIAKEQLQLPKGSPETTSKSSSSSAGGGVVRICRLGRGTVLGVTSVLTHEPSFIRVRAEGRVVCVKLQRVRALSRTCHVS